MKIFYAEHIDIIDCWLEITEIHKTFYYRFLNKKLVVRKVYDGPMPDYYFKEKEFLTLPPFVQEVIQKDIPANSGEFDEDYAQYKIS